MGEPYDMTEYADPSELGGTAADWNPPGSSVDYSDYAGSYGEDEVGPQPGPDIQDPGTEVATWASRASGALGGGFQLANRYFLGARTPGGYEIGGSVDTAPDVDTSPGLLPMPGGGTERGDFGCAPRTRFGAIMLAVRKNTGMRVRPRTILLLINRLGWKGAAAATGLGASDLLYVFVVMKTRRRGRLGPHLHTIEKRCRLADRYRRRVAKLAGHIHAGAGARRWSPYSKTYHRRRARHRRR